MEDNKEAKEEHGEMKISELEKWLDSFREKHGDSKLIEEIVSITRVMTHSQEHAKNKHTIYTDDKSVKGPKSVTTKDIFVDARSLPGKIYRWSKEAMKHKRYRYPTIAVCIFLSIYLLFNLPLIYNRISWQKSEDTQKLIVKTQEVVQKQMADSAALAPGEVIPSESRLIVPKISINVPVVYANSTDEKEIQNLLHSGVVHYYGTAAPGKVGNSFITGHSSNYWWDTGKYNQAFLMLDKLEPGDQAVIYNQGKKYVYTVRDKVVVAPEDLSVLAPTETPVLSLMTCTPPGTSWKRLVVRFDISDPVYYKPETVTKEKIVETPKAKEKSLISKIFSIFTPN